MTPKQAQCLNFIRASTTDGVPPSYEEIARGIGLSSKSGVARLIDGLEARGAIRRMPGRARALAVVEGGSDALGFIPNSTLDRVRDFARRRRISPEAAVARICQAYFDGRPA